MALISARNLSLLVVAYDEANARQFDWSHVGAAETHLVINYRKIPLSTLGNYFLDHRRPECDLFGIVHADTWIGPGCLDILCKCASQGSVAGLVGFSLVQAEANKEHKGHVWSWINGRRFDLLDIKPCLVSTLDSASCFFAIASGLRFDEKTFDGFHCHVEDLCLQAQSRGMPVVVPQCSASHTGNQKLQNWNDYLHQDRRRYTEKLAAKWPDVRFGTT